jgi:hypothetical protein
MEDLLANWGSYLSTSLYKDALCYFLGIPMENGHERFVSISQQAILHMSSLNKRNNNLRSNLHKYLDRSRFHELLWINFNQNPVDFSSLHNLSKK